MKYHLNKEAEGGEIGKHRGVQVAEKVVIVWNVGRADEESDTKKSTSQDMDYFVEELGFQSEHFTNQNSNQRKRKQIATNATVKLQAYEETFCKFRAEICLYIARIYRHKEKQQSEKEEKHNRNGISDKYISCFHGLGLVIGD